MAANVNPRLALLLVGTAALLLQTVHGGVMTSCNQVPYPEECRSLFAMQGSVFAGRKSKLAFRDFNLRGLLARAQQANLATSHPAAATDDPRSRAAWSDCLSLASDAVDFIARAAAAPAGDDSQTWLSAAATSLQTCRDGFAEIGLQPPPALVLSGNLSQLLSNSLAVNMASYKPVPFGGHLGGYPKWFSRADWRLLRTSSPKENPNLVVAKDGSGDHTTISEAVAAAASKRGGSSHRFVIYVKRGVYNESVEIKNHTRNIMIVGDGIDTTVVTGNKNFVDGLTTFKTATFAAVGDGFIARDITFENTAGPEKHQAVALRSGSDRSIFYRCSFKGYQDTLYVHHQRQFYRKCDVYGTIDFIFGNAAAVLQNCNIYVRKPMNKQQNTITAQARYDPKQNTGISIQKSVVTAAADLRPVQGSFETYLGRPWMNFSRTAFMKSTLDGSISPAGWLEWSGDFALSTLYYGEYKNSGAGACTAGRVKWPGFHVITNATEAHPFSVERLLAASS